MVIRKIYTYLINKINNRIFPKTELELLKERGLKVGKNFNYFNSHIDYGHCWLVEIGDDVTITNSTILAHDASMKLYTNKSKVGKVKVGNRVFIGYNSVILCNVTIGDDVIIGAGTIVNKDIPSNSIVVGNPCKIIGHTDDFINKHKNGLKSKKVYTTYWPRKTIDDIRQMQSELEDDFGYDE